MNELLGPVAWTSCSATTASAIPRAKRHRRASGEEIVEVLGVALVVGGSITIPQLRHAFALLESIPKTEVRIERMAERHAVA